MYSVFECTSLCNFLSSNSGYADVTTHSAYISKLMCQLLYSILIPLLFSLLILIFFFLVNGVTHWIHLPCRKKRQKLEMTRLFSCIFLYFCPFSLFSFLLFTSSIFRCSFGHSVSIGLLLRTDFLPLIMLYFLLYS